MQLTKKCPACGCNGQVYQNLITGRYKVSCEADDANCHDREHVNDWCVGACCTRYYHAEQEAINAWNNGEIKRQDNATND